MTGGHAARLRGRRELARPARYIGVYRLSGSARRPIAHNLSMHVHNGMRGGARARIGQRLRGPRARLPRRLDDLHGPREGIVVLPGYLTWHGHREFDVGAQAARLELYSIVLSQGARADLARYVNAGRLADDWPRLRDLLGSRTRRVAERRFGLALGRDRHSVVPG
jgi:hypothetical protein